MSVMQRQPDGSWNAGTIDGRQRGAIQPAQPDAMGMQRQAVIDQLGTAPPPAGGAQTRPMMPGAAPSSAFARGGQVKQLPGFDKNKLAETGASTAANVAGKIAGNTAGGAAAGMGIGLATGAVADKLKVKEEMPTFGGEFGHLTDDYGRRFEGTGGGIASNAVRYAGYGANPGLVAATGGLSIAAGAIGGAIKGAVTKNAPSAYTDFRVEDAADAIQKGYQEYLGRPASEDEIRTHLTNVGWDEKDGDRWTGEKALYHILGTLKNSDEAKQFATRGAVVDQLDSGGGGAAPYDNTPGSDIGPTTTFGDGSVMATTNKQNEDTLARQPANTLRLTGTPAGAEPTASRVAPGAVREDGASPVASGAAPGGGGRGTLEGFGGMMADGRSKLDASDSPKYQVARILQNYPSTPEGLRQALPELQKLGLGDVAIGGSKGDKLTFSDQTDPRFNGVTTFDVIRAAGNGGEAWQWDGGGGGGATAPAAGGGRLSGGLSAGAGGGDTLEAIKAELARILANQPNREALIAQMAPQTGAA
jgi:hypothetical protein